MAIKGWRSSGLISRLRCWRTDRFHLVRRDGGLLFADAPERRLTVAKLRANGSVETSFGNQGVCAIRDTPVWAESGIHAQELADGRISVGSNT